MSVLHFQEHVDYSADDHKIWNNAAFDNVEISQYGSNRRSWVSLESVYSNPKPSFDSVDDKENKGFVAEDRVCAVSSSLRSSMKSFKSLNVEDDSTKRKPRTVNKGILQKGLQGIAGSKEIIRDENKIDQEIQLIECEILRLKSRLETLNLEKTEKRVKASEKRGRAVPAKFMEQKQSVSNKEKIEPSSTYLGSKSKFERTGLSLGPAEISSARRKGLSLGPSEIFGSSKTNQWRRLAPNKNNIITPQSNRRKSCFWKLQEVDEEKSLSKNQIKSSSVSPKSRKVAAMTTRASSSRQVVATVSSRKTQKKEDVLINSVEPKNLFDDGEKSVSPTDKKPIRPQGRVVTSRYNQNTSAAMQNRSFPENDKDEIRDKKHSLSVRNEKLVVIGETEGKDLGCSASRVKKRWEIPNEIFIHCSLESEEKSLPPSPQQQQCVVNAPDMLPRIKIVRCLNETPRDSDAAKKVAELIGKRSYYCENDDERHDSISGM